jgi:hypothetical protein
MRRFSFYESRTQGGIWTTDQGSDEAPDASPPVIVSAPADGRPDEVLHPFGERFSPDGPFRPVNIRANELWDSVTP